MILSYGLLSGFPQDGTRPLVRFPQDGTRPLELGILFCETVDPARQFSQNSAEVGCQVIGPSFIANRYY